MTFEAGDRVIIVDGIDERHRTFIGHVCTITSCWHATPGTSIYSHGFPLKERYLYIMDFSSTWMSPIGRAADYAFRECDLKPYYDGMERSSWKDCVWKPKASKTHKGVNTSPSETETET